MSEKKYYWLKLPSGFFKDRAMKKLKKMAGGSTYTIIYQKLLLLSLENEGILFYEGIEDNFYEEMALELDEVLEDIQMTIMFLQKNRMMEQLTDNKFFMTQIPEMIGNETDMARRQRKSRLNKSIKSGNKSVTSSQDVTNCHTEIEIELDKDINNSLSEKNSDDENSYESVTMKLAKYLYNKIINNNPKFKEPNFNTWEKGMDSIIRIDKREISDIEKVIDWCQCDDFWKSNILSPAKLRKQFDGLYMKINNKSLPQIKDNKQTQAKNYEQRKYDDEDFAKFYENI